MSTSWNLQGQLTGNSESLRPAMRQDEASTKQTPTIPKGKNATNGNSPRMYLAARRYPSFVVLFLSFSHECLHMPTMSCCTIVLVGPQSGLQIGPSWAHQTASTQIVVSACVLSHTVNFRRLGQAELRLSVVATNTH